MLSRANISKERVPGVSHGVPAARCGDFFVVLAPSWVRDWKGKARSDEELEHLPPILSSEMPAEMNMQELPARVFKVIAPALP